MPVQQEERGFLAAKNEGALLVQPDPTLDDNRAQLDGDALNEVVVSLLADMPFAEVEELRTVIAESRERGYVTPEEIAAPLEDVEPSREQIIDLHQYLSENGIEIVSEDEARANGQDAQSPREEIQVPKKVELDLTVEPSLDSLRLYLRSIGRVD